METLVFVTNDAPFFVLHRLSLAKAARDGGYKVYVACPPDARSIREFHEAGVIYVPLALARKGKNPLSELRLLFSLIKLYKNLRPTIVHHATIKPVIYGSIAAKWTRVPACVNLISGLGYVFINDSFRNTLIRFAVKRLYRYALSHPHQRLIFQNPDDRELFISLGLVKQEDTLLIRGSGVDITYFTASPLPNDATPKIMLISRMLKDKGVEEFIRAAAILKSKQVNVECVLVGGIDKGNPAAIAESTLREWDNKGIVRWMGHQNDIAGLIKQAYAICLPSYREGLPNVLLQAAASGRPMITTDAPGCREVVDHGINGFVIPLYDDAAIARAIEELINNPGQAAAMGRAARQKAETQFALTLVIEQTLTVFAQLLSSLRAAATAVLKQP